MNSKVIFSFILILISSAFPPYILAVSILIAIILNYSKKIVYLGILAIISSIFAIPFPFFVLISLIFISIYFIEYLKINHSESRSYAIFFLSSSLAVFFIILPILNLLLSSNPFQAISDRNLMTAIFTGMFASFISTIIAILIGIPIAYVLARHEFNGKEIIEGIIDLPMIIPHIVAGIMLLLIFGPNGTLGSHFKDVGIVFYYALPGTIIAMLFVSFPIIVNSLREGIRKIDYRQELVAMSLGASKIKSIFTIVIPQIKRDIISSSLLCWARGMSEFGAIIIIAYYPMVASTYIYYLYTQYGLSKALPATSIMLLITLAVFIAVRILGGKKNASRG